jgi:cytochrome P450
MVFCDDENSFFLFIIGVIFSEGEEWKEHRRFILQTFRDFGVGKMGMEDKIVNEACDLIEALKKFDSRPVDNKVTLSTTVANIIAGVLAGMHYEASDPEFLQYLLHVSHAFQQTAEKTIMELWPCTQCLPVFRREKEKFFETQYGLRNFLKKICDDHLQRWTPGQNKDILDTYLSAVKSGQYKTFASKLLFIFK